MNTTDIDWIEYHQGAVMLLLYKLGIPAKLSDGHTFYASGNVWVVSNGELLKIHMGSDAI